MLALGVDAGGTKVLGAIVDEDGDIVERQELPTDFDRAEVSIRDVALALKERKPGIGSLGVGAAGFIDLEGRITYAPNVRYGVADAGPWLAGELGLKVLIDNDANCAAWAEWKFGSGRGSTNMVMLTLGTGVGGGIVIGGRLYRGSNGMAGELGHVVIDPAGGECACGRVGCLEAQASGNAIGRLARELGTVEAAEIAEDAGSESEELSGKQVAAAAQRGNRAALAVIERAGRSLGAALADFTNIFDPDVFVIGGGASDAREMILGPARDELAEQIKGGRKTPEVILASLGNDAGVIGAADLAREQGAR
ncbi:MAG TPA: ROK family protein [Actinomycetota bacterium]|nr:ROK family protein [Actinomycetota bacterium]